MTDYVSDGGQLNRILLRRKILVAISRSIASDRGRLTFAGETEAAKPVTVLVLAVLPCWHLRVRHVQESITLPLMSVMHALPSSAASSSQAWTDVIFRQLRLAAAMSRLDCALVMMVMVSCGLSCGTASNALIRS